MPILACVVLGTTLFGQTGIKPFPTGRVDLSGPVDLNGTPIKISPNKTDVGTVFIFVAPECPIANRYAPEIKRIESEYGPKGFVFWRVYMLPVEDSEAVRAHSKEYGYGFGALLDPQKRLVKSLGVRMTPEVAVIGSDGTMKYRGRIDSLNIEHGKIRANYRRDLRIALDEVRAGKPVSEPSTAAIGCFIGD